MALLRQVELLEEEWLGDEQTGSTPLLLSLAVNADSLATWLLPALANVLSDSPIRLNLQVEDETRTQERLRRGEGGRRGEYSAAGAAKLPGRSTRRARLPVRRLEGICATLFP